MEIKNETLSLREFAKESVNEVKEIIANNTFIDAYNTLSGYNLAMDDTFIGNLLIDITMRFDFNYKRICGTIFLTPDGQRELHEFVEVWDDNGNLLKEMMSICDIED